MIPQVKLQELRGDFELLKTEEIKPNFSALAKEYNIDRHTAAKYWKEGGIKVSPIERESQFDRYFDEIKEKAESVSCTKMALYKYFQNKYGKEIFHCYSSFAHYMQFKELRKKVDMKVHLRYETEPGHQLQLDWKEDLKTILTTGEIIEYNLFVATFGYSRYHYYVYSRTKTTEDFLRCLIEVLQNAGGVPSQLITDNMSAIVTITNGGKYKLPVIKQFEKDIGVTIHLCKVRTPETKGKVESANRFVQWLAPYNNELDTENALIQQIRKFNEEVNREANGTTGMPPVKLIKIEMEHLDPIPNAVLIGNYIQNVSVQTVPSTLLVRYKGSEYSVPAKFIGKRVKVIPVSNKLYIYFNTEVISIHELAARKINYHSEDYFYGLKQSMPDYLSDDEIAKRAEANLALLNQLGDITE